MQEIRDGRYPPEVLDVVDLIASSVRGEIAAARDRPTRAPGKGDIGGEGSRQHGLYLWGRIDQETR